MAWFTRKKQNLKKETLERKLFQNLRNKYTNWKSRRKNARERKQAEKEGRPFKPTQPIAESRERMQALSNAVKRQKEYKAAQKPTTFTNKNLNVVPVTLDNLTPKNIGDRCEAIGYRMASLKRAIENLNDDEDPSKLSRLYNSYATQYSDYDCQEEHVENLFPGPVTPPPMPKSIQPQENIQINLSKATEYTPEQQLENMIKEWGKQEQKPKKQKRARFFAPPLLPYRGGSRKRRSTKRRGRTTKKH
jgi:hypothetical protein